MMGFQAIRDGLQVRAAVTLGAFTDLAATLEGNPEAQSLAHRIWPDFERNREEIIHRRSALRWAEELKVPLLLLHGGEDEQISPRQTLRLGLRLEELGHPYQLYILEGQDHTVSDRAASRDHMAIRWFQRYQAGPIRRSGG
jgi:dipeptidyl aminopeptidase/acylaminoacyl peptidase